MRERGRGSGADALRERVEQVLLESAHLLWLDDLCARCPDATAEAVQEAVQQLVRQGLARELAGPTWAHGQPLYARMRAVQRAEEQRRLHQAQQLERTRRRLWDELPPRLQRIGRERPSRFPQFPGRPYGPWESMYDDLLPPIVEAVEGFPQGVDTLQLWQSQEELSLYVVGYVLRMAWGRALIDSKRFGSYRAYFPRGVALEVPEGWKEQRRRDHYKHRVELSNQQARQRREAQARDSGGRRRSR